MPATAYPTWAAWAFLQCRRLFLVSGQFSDAVPPRIVDLLEKKHCALSIFLKRSA